MKKHFLILLVLAAIGAWGQSSAVAPPVTTSQLTLQLQDAPGQVSIASFNRASGNPGYRTLYYWIVTQGTAGASSPAGPFAVQQAPNTMSASATIIGSWPPAANAASYDVLRTSSPTPPQGACNCAVATGVSTTSVTDNSESLSSYTVAELDPNILKVAITNQSMSAGRSQLNIPAPITIPRIGAPANPLTADDPCSAGMYWIAPIAGSTNAWRKCDNGTLSNIGNGGGGSSTAPYIAAFTTQTSITVLGATHGFATKALLVDCYDNASPANAIAPASWTVNSSNYNVVINFAVAQSGYCVINGGGSQGYSPQYIVAAGAPSGGTGNVGDMYINSTTSSVYGPKTSGGRGSIVANIKGLTGNNGYSPQYIVAAGAPSGGTGNVGDMYINSTTSDVYGPKTSGGWGSIVANIKGATGPLVSHNQNGDSSQESIWFVHGTIGDSGYTAHVTLTGMVGFQGCAASPEYDAVTSPISVFYVTTPNVVVFYGTADMPFFAICWGD